MIEIEGKFNKAIVYNDNCDDETKAQIKALCNLQVYEGCDIRIMPDAHKGKYCPIGTVIKLKDKVIPYTVGNDIGCGMSIAKFRPKKKLELAKVDKIIRENIPYGMNRNKTVLNTSHNRDIIEILSETECKDHIDIDSAMKCIGTLGGGNHFIEISKDNKNDLYYYITVHSGSRYLGTQVSEYYQNKAYESMKDPNVPFEFAWLEDNDFNDYMRAIDACSMFAFENRLRIINTILSKLKCDMLTFYSNEHNYISKDHILRKGSIQSNDIVIIPINMKDGILYGTLSTNEDWLNSGPHGSGRRMAKNQVANNYTVNSYKKDMNGIYCSVIGKSTLEESPFAYRSKDELLKCFNDNGIDTSGLELLKPIYNFKSDKR